MGGELKKFHINKQGQIPILDSVAKKDRLLKERASIRPALVYAIPVVVAIAFIVAFLSW